MEGLSNFATPGLLLGLILAFGFWLSRAGKPYNGILFNIHKLIALVGVVYMGWELFQWTKAAGLSGLLLAFVAVAALSVIALFASGGLLSAKKLDHALTLAVHRIGMAALLLTLGAIAVLWATTG